MAVLKRDGDIFAEILTAFMDETAKTAEEHYMLETKHGNLRVYKPEGWRKGMKILSVYARFYNESSLPHDANQHSGKWNLHLTCDKGQGEQCAEMAIQRFQAVKKPND